MGLDIEIKSAKEIRCPHCGEFLTDKIEDEVDSCGRGWYDILEEFGYYVPYEKRTEENDWYGKDMALTDMQALALANYACDNNLYNFKEIDDLVNDSLGSGSKVIINADW